MRKMFSALFILLVLGLSSAFAQDKPAWQTIELTNAATLETFTFADFEGKTVFVEPMATWCSNCRSQLRNVQEASLQTDDSVVYIALSVEGNLANEALAEYAEKEGFSFIFAVASTELLQALVEDFGRSVTNPPATPHFIISADGSFGELVTGRESAEQLLEQIMAAN